MIKPGESLRCRLRQRRFRLRPAVALLAALTIEPAWAESLRMGRAVVDITPPAGMPFQVPQVPPYLVVPAEGVHDPLQAKAMVLEQGGVRAAIVACDLTTLPRPIIVRIRELIGKISTVPPENVMITATHTHTGPVLGARYFQNGSVSQKEFALAYLDRLPRMIAESVRLAELDLAAVRLQAAIGTVPNVAYNRRFLMKDGRVRANPGKENPEELLDIVSPAGPVDASMSLLYFESPQGEPLLSLFNFGMHPDTTGGRRFSADYPHVVSRILGDVKGPEMLTLFTLGAAGDVNHYFLLDPQRPHRVKGEREAARIGALLAGEIVRNYTRMDPVAGGPLKVSREQVPLIANKKVNAAPGTARAGEGASEPTTNPYSFEAEVMTITLGDRVAFVGIPGEIFAELGLLLKQRSPFRYTILNAIANGGIGYVPSNKALSEGSYGASQTTTRCTPGSGEALVDSAVRQLIAHRAITHNPNRR